MKHKKTTSWGGVAKKYAQHVAEENTYHNQVIGPNLLRIIAPTAQMRILEIGCGEGYFTRMLSAKSAHVVGSDISPELIALAKKQSQKVTYHVANSERLSFSEIGQFDVVLAVLTLQNCERIDLIFKECERVLSKKGRLIFVLNHPAFRIPKRSSWVSDAQNQYRRIDGYLTSFKTEIDMNPGREEVAQRKVTYSFHRSLQDYSKALRNAGFAMARIEEWISHKESQKGPAKEKEDRARKEIPLFMCVECLKI